MFGMGVPEIMLILAIALIVIGPKKLPELAKSLGRAMNEFKHATSELKDSFELENDTSEIKKSFEDIDRELKKPIDMTPEKKDAPESDIVKENETKTENDIEQVYAPEKKGELSSPSAPGLVEKKQDSDEEDEMPATDIPAELMEDDELQEAPEKRESNKPEIGKV